MRITSPTIGRKPSRARYRNPVKLRTLLLRIERTDGVAPYEAKYKGLFMIGNIPDEGSIIRLRVDPADPRHFVPAAMAFRVARRGDLTDSSSPAAKRRVLDG
jgi:hypothetical protein